MTRSSSFWSRAHPGELYSRDGSTVDAQVASLLVRSGRTVAVAESCTGGLMSARLTERGGSSEYFVGGAVVYSNEAKVSLAAVDPGLIERVGAVSVEVAEALAVRRCPAFRRRFRDRDHGDRRTGRRQRGEAGRHRVLLDLLARRRPPDAPDPPARGAVRTSASGRPPWRCTCCVACCWGRGWPCRRPPPASSGREAAGVVPPLAPTGSAARTVSVPPRVVSAAGAPCSPVTDGRARLFVALELPASARDILARWRGAALRDIAALRPVPVEHLHATLCFLGSRPVHDIDEIAAACGVVAGEPVVESASREAVWLPARRPRVLAVRLEDDGALARIQATLSAALVAGGWYAPESQTRSWPTSPSHGSPRMPGSRRRHWSLRRRSRCAARA